MKREVIQERSLRILREAGYADQQGHHAGQQPHHVGQQPPPTAALLPALPWPSPRATDDRAANAERLPDDLLPDARLLIEEGARDTYCLAVELAQRCGLRGKRFNRALRALIPLSRFVETRILHVGVRSRPPKWVRVTEEGFRALGLQPPPETTRPGGQHLHRFWLERVARKLRNQGRYVQVLIDTAIAGKRVDIAALTEEGQWVCFEVELQDTQKDLMHNVTKDLTVCNMARVTVLVTRRSQTQKAEKTLKAQLPQDLLERVGIEPLGNYL